MFDSPIKLKSGSLNSKCIGPVQSSIGLVLSSIHTLPRDAVLSSIDKSRSVRFENQFYRSQFERYRSVLLERRLLCMNYLKWNCFENKVTIHSEHWVLIGKPEN